MTKQHPIDPRVCQRGYGDGGSECGVDRVVQYVEDEALGVNRLGAVKRTAQRAQDGHHEKVGVRASAGAHLLGGRHEAHVRMHTRMHVCMCLSAGAHLLGAGSAMDAFRMYTCMRMYMRMCACACAPAHVHVCECGCAPA